MKITVLNGSTKGEASVTLQYVRFIQKAFPRHEWNIVHIAQRIKKIEQNEQVFQEIVDQVRSSDGVLWAFSLHYFLVNSQYKRFIELIWEREVQDAFEGKYAAALSTSIHFFDHLAHNYVHAICDDLEMRYVDAFSADGQDLIEERGRANLLAFARDFIEASKRNASTPKSYAPMVRRSFDYVPAQAQGQIDASRKKIVMVTDAQPHQTNLVRMAERFGASFSQDVETINLHELDVKGGCLGCLRCGYDNQCAYLGKDEYVDFYNTKLKPADILVFAGAIKDRHLSSRWKMFFDRSYFNTNTPSLRGKQFGFIISGPLGQIPNLRQFFEAYVQFQQSNVVGFVTDEFGDSLEIDRLLQNLAERLVRFSDDSYVKPSTFLGVGGAKIIRDAVRDARIVFQADHRAYKELGMYDSPPQDVKMRVMNGIVPLLFRMQGFRREFRARMKDEMLKPYQKVLQS